ncbi:hypothetical protein [Spongiimicrobium salis]|uniref:hypothetical protein n=1 Tax=Spongiimicrobium salis TaxID=1667022 RepID=UPI00374DF224
MKLTMTILAVLMTSIGVAQDKYEKGMQKAFELWKAQKTTEASNMFERIATAELDNWLPYYYVAQINTMVAFGEKEEKKLAQKLEKAQEFLDIAKGISPNNVEIMVQQAMIHTAWVAYDGATYGPTLGGKVVALYQKALKMAPENPRVVFSNAEWGMGSAAYFGQDTAPYCSEVKRSLELFAKFKPESAFHPNWGKERAEMVSKNCEK